MDIIEQLKELQTFPTTENPNFLEFLRIYHTLENGLFLETAFLTYQYNKIMSNFKTLPSLDNLMEIFRLTYNIGFLNFSENVPRIRNHKRFETLTKQDAWEGLYSSVCDLLANSNLSISEMERYLRDFEDVIKMFIINRLQNFRQMYEDNKFDISGLPENYRNFYYKYYDSISADERDALENLGGIGKYLDLCLNFLNFFRILGLGSIIRYFDGPGMIGDETIYVLASILEDLDAFHEDLANGIMKPSEFTIRPDFKPSDKLQTLIDKYESMVAIYVAIRKNDAEFQIVQIKDHIMDYLNIFEVENDRLNEIYRITEDEIDPYLLDELSDEIKHIGETVINILLVNENEPVLK